MQQDPDPAKAERVMQALMDMTKLYLPAHQASNQAWYAGRRENGHLKERSGNIIGVLHRIRPADYRVGREGAGVKGEGGGRSRDWRRSDRLELVF